MTNISSSEYKVVLPSCMADFDRNPESPIIPDLPHARLPVVDTFVSGVKKVKKRITRFFEEQDYINLGARDE